MKIYFTASARGLSQLKTSYKDIYDSIDKLGHSNIDKFIPDIYQRSKNSSVNDEQAKLFGKHMNKIKSADVVVLEISINSLSIGYVLQKALEIGKPVIALYLRGHDPFFATGIDNEKLQVIEYSEDNILETLKHAINYAQDKQDTRFNFFISPKHQNYLDWISKTRKIPRSVYLRDLIESDMNDNREYHD